VWHENSRKDYYEIQPEIFENAFRNNFELIKSNTRLAKQLKTLVVKEKNKNLETLKNRLTEMQRFYELTEKHYNNFLDEWEVEREKIYSK
jgi:glutamate racemase